MIFTHTHLSLLSLGLIHETLERIFVTEEGKINVRFSIHENVSNFSTE